MKEYVLHSSLQQTHSLSGTIDTKVKTALPLKEHTGRW